MSEEIRLPAGLSFLRNPRVILRIGLITVAFGIAGFIYGLMAPRWYRSMLTIVPGSAQRSVGISSLLGSELGGLASGLGGLSGGGADAARIVSVLQSNSVTDGTIDKFDLMTRYRTRYRESAREALWYHCEAKALPKPNLVVLSCEDTDPKFAQELLAFMAEIGNQVFRRVNRSSASEEVRFLDARANELRQQADEAAAKVRNFQELHQVVDLDAQARAVVAEMAALSKQKIGKQMELEYARSFSSRDEASARQLEAQLSVVEEKMQDLESDAPPPAAVRNPSANARPGKTGMFPAALTVPKLRAEFEKLYRDRKVAEATLVFVLERLEGAKASEARNVSTFQVLDPPALPTRKTRPSRMLILLGAMFVGFAGSTLFEWWRAGGQRTIVSRFRSKSES